MISFVRCYFMAVPVIVWGLLLQFGITDDDASRVPFLLTEGLAVIVSVQGLRTKYRNMR